MKPSWRVDGKWLAAIAFALCATVASLTYSLYRVTAPEPATGAAAPVIEAMTRGALNDELFAEMQLAAQAQPEAEVQAQGVTIPLTGEEIAGLSRDQLLKESSARLADILYYQGAAAGEAYFQDLTPNQGEPAPPGPATTDTEDEGLQLDMLAMFSQGTHSSLRPFAVALSLLAATLLAALVLLSRGFGRLGSPGVALAAAFAPAVLVTTLFRGALASGRDSSEGALADVAAALYPTISDLVRTFALLAVLGLAMALVAVAGQVAAVIVGRWRRARAAASAA